MIKWLAAAAMLSTQAATPPSPAMPVRCLTRQQVGDLSVIGASIFVSGARSLCRERLAGDAFLASRGAERFETRLRAEAERRFDRAIGGLDRVMPEGGPMAPALMGTMLRGLMAGGPPPQMAPLADGPNCSDLSEMVEAMSGMSPERISQFSGAFASLASRMEHREREQRYQARLRQLTEPPQVSVPVQDEDEDESAPAPAVPPAPVPSWVVPVPSPAPAEPEAPPPPPTPFVCPG